MLNIAILDDERAAADKLSQMIRAQLPDCGTKEFFSAESLISCPDSFDIYFLDIKLRDITGIEAARFLRKRKIDAPIIFVTGDRGYALDAFDIGAVHYLIKPVNEKNLQEALKRAISQTDKARFLNRHKEKQFIIKSGGKIRKLDFSDIMYFESRLRKIFVHTIKGDFSFYGSMSEVENQLPPYFFKSHRAFFVNLHFVSKYDTENICLKDGSSAYLSRANYKNFVKAYMRFLKGDPNE